MFGNAVSIVPLAVTFLAWVFMIGLGVALGRFLMPNRRRSPALDLLQLRYVRGEISREEYLRLRRDLR